MYDPWAGVWLTKDPLRGEPSRPRTLHRYSYAFASPISYYDPYGLTPVSGFQFYTLYTPSGAGCDPLRDTFWFPDLYLDTGTYAWNSPYLVNSYYDPYGLPVLSESQQPWYASTVVTAAEGWWWYDAHVNEPIRQTLPTLAMFCPLTWLTGCTVPPTATPTTNTTQPFLEVLEADFDLRVSSEFTLEERQQLNLAYEQYAHFLGGREAFVQVIIQQGGLREIAMDRGGTTGRADPSGTLTLHDFSYVLDNGLPMYTLDETGMQDVAFTKLAWHETAHYLQFAMPESVDKYVELTPELNWYPLNEDTFGSTAPGSGRVEDYERMADAFAATLDNQVYADQFGVSSGAALPETFGPWLLEQLGRR